MDSKGKKTFELDEARRPLPNSIEDTKKDLTRGALGKHLTKTGRKQQLGSGKKKPKD